MDADDLSRLYRTFSPDLLGSLHRRFPWSNEIVEDAVQHAFAQLNGTSRTPDEPRAWLRTVARHYIIDQLRAEGKLVHDDDLVGDAPANADATSNSAGISPTLVQRALLLLTTRAQRLLRGKYQDGRTYGSLARQEGVAKSGMGRILDRARERLRKAVEGLRNGR